jgi:two-component system response regulator RegA
LIVDDDGPFLRRLARAMEGRGFAVEVAESVAEGIAKSKARPPKYAVVDLRLGDGNGLDVIEAIRQLREDTKAIVLTGYGNIATAVTAVKLGALDYLAKPADADDIFHALTQRPGEKADVPENPMSADRVRWGAHPARLRDVRTQRFGDGASAEHAPADAAADPRQAGTEIEPRSR